MNRQQRRAAEREQAKDNEAQQKGRDFFAVIDTTAKVRVSARSHNDARRKLHDIYNADEDVSVVHFEQLLRIQEGPLSAEEDALFERALEVEFDRPFIVEAASESGVTHQMSAALTVYNEVLRAADALATSDIGGLLEAAEAVEPNSVDEFKEMLRAATAFRDAKWKFDMTRHTLAASDEAWAAIEKRMEGAD